MALQESRNLKEAYSKVRSWSFLCAHAYVLHGSTQALGQGLQSDSCRSFLIQADTLLETSDPVINCSLSVIATITVIQGLLVKLQVYWLMSGSVCAIWDQTKLLSQKQEFSCPSDFQFCLIFLKVKVIHSLTHMQCNQPCGRRKGSTVWMFGELKSGYAQVYLSTTLCFLPLGKAGHLPNLYMGLQRGIGTWPNRSKENFFSPSCLPALLKMGTKTHKFSSSYL